MTATLTAPRLSLQTLAIADETTTIRSLDWDRDRFDIEFGLQNGTTYNSYLIFGDKTALVDTSHGKFREIYLAELQKQIDLSCLDYLIISHTEPDHSGLVKDVLRLAPQVTVVGTKVALQFLQDLVHHEFKQQIVKNGDQIDLGKGHVLQFVNAPNLHWPDTMMTYDHKTGVLFTCDIFGMHYCRSEVFDQSLTAIMPDYRFYYECLMAPNARSVLAAMKRMDELPPVTIVANGHGPLLRYNVKELTENYRTWSQSQTKGETNVVIFYVSDYGYSDRVSQAIGRGIIKTGVAVEMRDLRTTDLQEIRELVEHASGVVFTTPPQSLEVAQTGVATIIASLKAKQGVGIFESFGGEDEAIDLLANRCQDLGTVLGFPLIRLKAAPTEATYQLCEEAGTDLGQLLSRKQQIQQMKAIDNDLDKAMGRLAGGLYIITAKKGELTSAMLASWVSQASFKPIGVTIAVAKDRAIEALMQVGDHFVLNVLEENNYSHLMRHFLKRFAPGADRFAGVKTQPSRLGIPILTEALAYLECRVESRMDANDHWIVYATGEEGKVSKPDALTAAHYRKVGNHY
ncbi:MAG: diflavin flavoprotein A [Cyanobacteria bacterium M5B4]|nr:MAG: diflavin flavoprotein A [Cyanobacteria bacterium M5B4]